jgi:hypothetical protein
MRVGKRPVETIKDGNEDCDRTGRNEIEKIDGNGHETLLLMACVSIAPMARLSRARSDCDWLQEDVQDHLLVL